MGIRFLCPACGAKLNVKAELAGKRGACPKCRAKIQIPHAEPEAEVAPASAAVAPATVPPPPGPAPVVPQAAPAEARWFVRPPSGGQYGPALESVLRTWVGEGRITPDTMIRRDGDGDWQTAASVFPELGGAAAVAVKVSPAPVVTAPVNVGPVVASPSSAPLDASSAAAAMLLARRKRARKMGLLVMAILILAVLILLPILIYVLLNPAAPPTEEPTTALHLRIPDGEDPCHAASFRVS